MPLLLWHMLVDLPLVLLLITPLTAGIEMGGERLDHRLIRAWSAGLMRVFGFRLRRIGTPLPGAAMFVANHVSWVDIVMLHSQRMMGFVAKREIAGWPVVGWMAARGETIFHQRGSTESLGGVLHEMLARLRSGHSVGVFPEGRTRGGREVGPFHARIFLAAVEAGVPVQPVALRYGVARRCADARSRSSRAKASSAISCACWASRRGWPRSHFLAPIAPGDDRRPPPHRRTGARAHRRGDGQLTDAELRFGKRSAAHADQRRNAIGRRSRRRESGMLTAADYRPPRGCAIRTCSRCSAPAALRIAARRGLLAATGAVTPTHLLDGGEGVRLQGLHSVVPGRRAARHGAAAARLGRQRRIQLHAR